MQDGNCMVQITDKLIEVQAGNDVKEIGAGGTPNVFKELTFDSYNCSPGKQQLCPDSTKVK